MNPQIQATRLIEYSKKQRESYNRGPNKSDEAYHSYFFRTSTEESSVSPCQSSKTKRVERTASRRNDRRTSIYNRILKQFESTHQNEIQVLRQQNIELKKTIAELKISCFYKLDETKIKSMILGFEQVRNQLKIALQHNQGLRLQNDFLSRANTQLRIEISRLQKSSEGVKNKNVLCSTDRNWNSMQCMDKISCLKNKTNSNQSPEKCAPLQILRESSLNQDFGKKTTPKISLVNSPKPQKSCDVKRVKSERLITDKLRSSLKKSCLNSKITEE